MASLHFTARVPVFDANVRVGDLYVCWEYRLFCANSWSQGTFFWLILLSSVEKWRKRCNSTKKRKWRIMAARWRAMTEQVPANGISDFSPLVLQGNRGEESLCSPWLSLLINGIGDWPGRLADLSFHLVNA